MASNAILFIALAFLNSIRISMAFDPSPLQDFCVAPALGLAVTSTCKDPKLVTADDFFGTLQRVRRHLRHCIRSLNAGVQHPRPDIHTRGVRAKRVLASTHAP
ncbi:germin-like protein subfamily 1 member 11 [Salvia divinorum]|uniref:Germin-like protein subfamily 1 member 11 n=1 Tax=Salvia divinorum TaxID=28513 RepID=A0ABD1HMP7_SALDI